MSGSRWAAAAWGICFAAQRSAVRPHGPAHSGCVHEDTPWCSGTGASNLHLWPCVRLGWRCRPNPGWAQVQSVATQAGVPELATVLETAGGAVGNLDTDGACRARAAGSGRGGQGRGDTRLPHGRAYWSRRCAALCRRALRGTIGGTHTSLSCMPRPPAPAATQLLNVTDLANVFELYAGTKEYICCGLKDTAYDM